MVIKAHIQIEATSSEDMGRRDTVGVDTVRDMAEAMAAGVNGSGIY